MEIPSAQSIVIVDDEKSFTDMIGQLLEDYFTTPVHTFTHPADALKNLVSLQPGIVITDYYMPGMNGLELIQAVKTLSTETPCILITGHSVNLEEQVETGLSNLKAVLSKPFRWQHLAEMIELHWKGSRPPGRHVNRDSL